MTDLLPIIMGCFRDPDYWYMAGKLIKVQFGKRTPFFGSADINNICNLKCKHCYWWINRKDVPDELSAEEWRAIIRNTFKKHHLLQVTIAGGEPMLRPDIIKVFSEELPNKFSVVSNGTTPLHYFDGMIAYWISIDGPEHIHNYIRGPVYSTIRQNVQRFVEKHGRKKVWIAMTVNSFNYRHVEEVAKEWHDLAYQIAFQLHTPFSDNDPLWIPYGEERERLIDKILEMKKSYGAFVMNSKRQINMLRRPWGGIGTTPTRCPTWAILALDHLGRVKQPCCIGSGEEKSIRPICEKCGLAPYSAMLSFGISNHGIAATIESKIRPKQKSLLAKVTS